MKRVSFEVAKAIKEAGYPQHEAEGAIVYSEQGNFCITHNEEVLAYPTYMEVWLWLWREKKIRIELAIDDMTDKSYPIVNRQHDWLFDSDEDPEEAIIAAIEYLIKNDIIK